MNRLFFFGAIAVTLTTAGRGGGVDDAILAAMKLPEAKSYTWMATVQDDGRFYLIDGKTERNGYTLVNMPMVSSIQRKIGAGSDIHTAIFKGNATCAISTPDGWKTREELAQIPLPSDESLVTRRRNASRHGLGSGGAAWLVTPNNLPFRYSNLQLNLSHPHDEIGIIVGSYRDAREEEEGISGSLSEEGAKLLLVHPGQDEITPLQANGTFRLWFKNGVLVQYEVRLTGKIAVGNFSSRREITLHQNTVTALTAMDATTFTVPEEVKLKLE